MIYLVGSRHYTAVLQKSAFISYAQAYAADPHRLQAEKGVSEVPSPISPVLPSVLPFLVAFVAFPRRLRRLPSPSSSPSFLPRRRRIYSFLLPPL